LGLKGFLPQTIFLALWYSLAALLLSGAITFSAAAGGAAD
jgi:hypothetical protein